MAPSDAAAPVMTPPVTAGAGPAPGTAQKPASASDEARTEVRGTLSELLARILDQLSVSAWLPAGVLVASLLVLGTLHTHHNHLGPALKSIGDLELNSIVLLVSVVVIMTVVTQAFEFEAIRMLEGYWGAGLLATTVGGLMCHLHLKRRERLEKCLVQLQRKIFPRVRHRMLERMIPQAVVNIIEAGVTEQPVTGSEAEFAQAESICWLDHAAPHHRRRIDALGDALDEFPDDSLTLPTRLGNVLRAAEEPLMYRDSGPLEGRMLTIHDALPAAIQYEHDQFRGRLDVYCSLVLVFVVLGLSAIPILASAAKAATTEPVLIALTVAAAAAVLSYRAALASARKWWWVWHHLPAVYRASRSHELLCFSLGTPTDRAMEPAWSPRVAARHQFAPLTHGAQCAHSEVRCKATGAMLILREANYSSPAAAGPLAKSALRPGRKRDLRRPLPPCARGRTRL